MTLDQLARGYIEARSSQIYERSGDFERDFRKLRWLLRYEINPLLQAAGIEPLPESVISYDFTEEE